MLDAGWQWWLTKNDEHIMFRHADEDISLTIEQCNDLFKQWVNTGFRFIPDPYEEMGID